MKIAIVDDDKKYIQREEILLKQNPDYEVKSFTNLKAYENSEEVFDLLLLDIELGNDDSISYIQSHSLGNTYIIYVSSHKERCYDAFHFNVLGFVLKDRIESELLKKIEYVEKVIEKERIYHYHSDEIEISIKEKEILYFNLEYASVYLQTTQQRIKMKDRTLSNIEESLSKSFYHINRNTIVNMKKIKNVCSREKIVVMEDNHSFKISRRRWKDFVIRCEKLKLECLNLS